jgi:tripartite-type tricarboxylate transporter receptor subunit TctC
MHRRDILVLTGSALAAPAIARAQGDWPERPVRLIVPFPPGGSTDTIARIFQPKLSEVLGKQVVVENRGGASGSVGAIEAARAAPDGHTRLLAYDNEATNPTVMRLPYKLADAFAPVNLVATGPRPCPSAVGAGNCGPLARRFAAARPERFSRRTPCGTYAGSGLTGC